MAENNLPHIKILSKQLALASHIFEFVAFSHKKFGCFEFDRIPVSLSEVDKKDVVIRFVFRKLLQNGVLVDYQLLEDGIAFALPDHKEF